MVIWATLETSCPICRHRLRVREVGGGVPLGQDSDLMIRMPGKHVIQAEIHTCHNCKFSGTAEDFLERRISPAMVERFFDDVHDRLEDSTRPAGRPSQVSRTPLPHVQHYWSALAGSALGLTPGEIGRRYLRAYWCLRIPPSSDLPETRLRLLRKAYLRDAIASLRQGLRFDKERVIVYLIGELCRRNGNFGLAAQYFERFLERENGPHYLNAAAERLLHSVHEKDASEKTMEEVVYGQNDGGRRSKDGPKPGSSAGTDSNRRDGDGRS